MAIILDKAQLTSQGQNLYQKKWQLKQQIDQATTYEEIDQIS